MRRAAVSPPWNIQTWNSSLLTSDATETLDKLRSFLRSIGDDLKRSTKLFVMVGKPLEERHAINDLQLHTSL